MSFIQKESNVVINAKLTSTGRKLLASGALTFDKIAVGDSEIDYNVIDDGFDVLTNFVLKPSDNNGDIKYKIPSTQNGDLTVDINNLRASDVRIVNEAPERGFFSGNTTDGFTAKTDTTFVKQPHAKATSSNVTGGTTLIVEQSTLYSSITTEPEVGDLMLVNWRNPYVTASTSFNGYIDNTTQFPYLWYKIESKSGTLSSNTLEVTVDRELPNFGTGSIESPISFYPYGNVINTYYTSGSTGSTTCCLSDNIPIWNFTVVHSKNMAGILDGFETYEVYDSTKYAGFKEFVNKTFLDDNQKSLGIIHYSNKSKSNNYGEAFNSNSPVIELPTIYGEMNDDGSLGITLSGDTIKKSLSYQGRSFLIYYDLKDQFGNVVGKIFNDLKVFVIEDEELIAAMSYKSDRNWTLPELSTVNYVSKTSTETDLIQTSNDIFYISYLLENTTGSTNNVSYGLSTVLPCQKYTKFESTGFNNTTINKTVLEVEMSNIPHLKNDFNTGEGFTANKFYLLINKNNSGFPDTTAWKKIDFTSQVLDTTYDIVDPDKLSTESFRIDGSQFNTSATTFDLHDYIDIPTDAQTDKLQFGDEEFFFGNVKTDIESIVYRSQFNIRLNSNNYNTSNNPTWSTDKSVYITEIGIYSVSPSGNNILVAIGKLAQPVKKQLGSLQLITLTIDF